MNKQELRTNKQELISKYELLKNSYNFDVVAIDDIISDLKRLDEPEKVEIPQLAADWIEVCKENLAIGLYTAMNPDFLEQWNKSDELICWIRKTSNQELFALAWIFGYEVKKEKRYLVVMPNVSSIGGVLTHIKHDDSWIWIGTLGTIVEGRIHTRKELEEAGFSWVFSCDGVEVKEVDE